MDEAIETGIETKYLAQEYKHVRREQRGSNSRSGESESCTVPLNHTHFQFVWIYFLVVSVFTDSCCYIYFSFRCPVDDTVVVHQPPNPRKARFSIESFAFLGHFIGGTVSYSGFTMIITIVMICWKRGFL